MNEPPRFPPNRRVFGRAQLHISHSETITTLDRVGSKPRMGTGFSHLHQFGADMRDAVRKTDAVSDPAADVAGDGNQRSAPRFTLLIRSAKLTTPEAEYLCVVRDASDSGISVRLFHPLPPKLPVTLELPNGDRHLLERVWEEEGKAGFTFAEATDLERIVEGPSRFSRRAMRVNLELPCELMAGVRRIPATLRNLSQQGALVCTDERLSLVQRIKLHASGLPQVTAKVRWRRGDQYGLSFEDNFQFGDLAKIVYDLQDAGAA